MQAHMIGVDALFRKASEITKRIITAVVVGAAYGIGLTGMVVAFAPKAAVEERLLFGAAGLAIVGALALEAVRVIRRRSCGRHAAPACKK
ncbi:MAG: hypothetical protein WC464_04520 [Bdellovibrionales bacterium]